MRASTKRALSLLASSGFVVFALIVYITLIQPEYEMIKELRGGLDSNIKILADTRTALLGVDKLKIEYKQNEKKIDTLSLALPSEESVSSIVAQINNRSEANSLIIQSIGINYLPIKSPIGSVSLIRGIGTLQLDLRIFGSYSSFKRFLQDLERNVRIMDVRNLRLESAGKPDQDLYAFNLTVDTYYQPK
ncbi:MAG: type 4a pilus biogenesis protein PilO [Candidatus Harrisonbacteria bacterium]|nr:type 4a pilus biogenesis protein PilO [Candidatus Harrisonbacteria bacterium]